MQVHSLILVQHWRLYIFAYILHTKKENLVFVDNFYFESYLSDLRSIESTINDGDVIYCAFNTKRTALVSNKKCICPIELGELCK